MIAEIESIADVDEQEFAASLARRKAVMYNLLIIGEAARAIPEPFRSEHSQVPWRQIIAMRNVLTHEYDRVITRIVWEVVQKDLPVLKRNVAGLIHQLDRANAPPPEAAGGSA